MATIITDPTTLISGGDSGTSFAAPLSIDTSALTITITPGSGVLPVAADGVSGQALYSALKLLWKNSSTYIKYPFPMEAITPEQFEFINGWSLANNVTRKAIRTAGWVEKDSSGNVLRTYSGIISLGSLGATDQPYYQQNGTTFNPINFSFQGPVNEAIPVKITAAIPAASVNTTNDTFTLANNGLVDGDYVQYTQGGTALTGLTNGSYYYVVNSVEGTGVFQVSATRGGSAITWTESPTGTYTFVKDSTAFCKLFAREYQKTYSSAQLSDIGVTGIGTDVMKYIVYRFPLANAADNLKITHADGTMTSGVYANISISWCRDSGNNNSLFTVKGDWVTATSYVKSDVVKGSNGRWFKCTANHTSGASTQPITGGSYSSNWAAYTEGEKQIGTTYYPFTIIIDGDTSVAETASGAARTTEIYEKVQYLLRQSTDVDSDSAGGTGSVVGKTADSLLRFVGDTLVTSTGVFIGSINSNDTNSIEFYDATAQKRTYPYTAAGSFEFNSYLVNDASAIYRLYYKQLQGASNKFGGATAILVKDASGSPADISGNVSGASSKSWSFAYDGNTQTETQWQSSTSYVAGDEYKNGTTWYRVTTPYTSDGTFGTTDTSNSTALDGTTDGPSVVAVSIGLGTGQYVSANAKLLRATGQKIALTAAQERNYQNT